MLSNTDHAGLYVNIDPKVYYFQILNNPESMVLFKTCNLAAGTVCIVVLNEKDASGNTKNLTEHYRGKW